MPSAITIPSRFNGPARSGNGGYSAGAIGELVAGPARVRLHSPPPLGTPMDVTSEGNRLIARLGDSPVLEASPAEPPGPPPPFVPLDVAADAKTRYAGYDSHAAPTCFVCGTERSDGLNVHPGVVEQPGFVASPWTPDASTVDGSGVVEPRVVWAVLDCPGAWAAWSGEDDGEAYFPALGLMTVEVLRPIQVDRPHVVVARLGSAEGRKLSTSAAIYSDQGELAARADHIEIKVPYNWAL